MTDTTEIPSSAPADANEPLVPAFAKVTEAFWADRVQRMRADKGITGELVRTDEDGIDVRWLYTPGEALGADPAGLPGEAPFVRGTRVGAAWDIRQEHAHPVVRTANAQLLEDLNGGVTSCTIRFDETGRTAAALDGDAFAAGRGRGGTSISTVDDLDLLLEGVYLDLAPVALDAGPAAVPAAALLRAVWERRELDLAAVQGSFGIDPIGTLATEGRLLDAPEEAVALAGRIAAETAIATPKVQALRVDTRAFVGAGATPALELAIAASIGTAYLRAGVAAGLSAETAASQIEFQLTATQVQFQEIAKLRAFRRIWARILEASGVPEAGRRSPLYARATERMLSRVDPWTNLLRGTTSLFGAAAGGADGATVAAFDALLGDPSTLGRRMARNTQIVLLEESGLARVADPAGGSWYIESYTDEIAKAAWAHLQRIEGAGGVLPLLTGGALQAELAELQAKRATELVSRTRELTGVNTFPLLGDEGLDDREPSELAPLDLDDLAAKDRDARLARPAVDALERATPGATLEQLTALAAAGARVDELAPLAHGGSPHDAAPLETLRDAAPFEGIRDAALAAGSPKVLVAPVGSQASTVNIVTWARNYFAVGGLEAVVPGPDEDAPTLAASGDYPVAVLCPGRGVEDDAAIEVVKALREAGVTTVILASGKDDRAQALGADRAVRDGLDMVAALTDIQQLFTARQDA